MARLVDPFLAELDQEAQTTRRCLDRIPEGRLAWKPHRKSFSLGQLGLHVATLPGAVAGMFAKDSLEIPDFVQPEGKSRTEILAALDSSVSEARGILGKMDDDRMRGTWKLTRNGREIMAAPRVALLRSILLNHWYHHRGMLSVYLRLLDVPVPSVYGPTADENPFAS